MPFEFCVFSPTPVPTSPEATELNPGRESHWLLRRGGATPSKRRPCSQKGPRAPTPVLRASSGSRRPPRPVKVTRSPCPCLLRSAACVSARSEGDRQGDKGEGVRKTDGHTCPPPPHRGCGAWWLARRVHRARTHGRVTRVPAKQHAAGRRDRHCLLPHSHEKSLITSSQLSYQYLRNTVVHYFIIIL